MILRIPDYNWCIFTFFCLTFVGVILWALFFCSQLFDILQTAPNILFRVTINKLINGENKLMRRGWNVSRRLRPYGLFRVLFPPLSPRPPLLLKWTVGTDPLLNRWWYFDFTFPFPVYHILIRSPTAVTSSIQLHLLKRTQTLLSIWNIVRRPRKTSVFTVRKSNLASGASYYLLPLGQKNEISPPGTANPPLVCTAAAIQQNKIIPVAA